MGAEYSQHHTSCTYCQHFQRWCNIVQDKVHCSVCIDFLTLHGKWIDRYHPEWNEQWFFMWRNRCPCCTIQDSLNADPERCRTLIPDHSWNPIWKNLEKKLKDFPINNSIVCKEDKNFATTVDKYKKAIENGTAVVACGRITTIYVSAATTGCLSTWLNPLFKNETGKQPHCLLALRNNEFCTISETDEIKQLGMLAKVFMTNNPDSFLYDVASNKVEIIKVFKDSATAHTITMQTEEPEIKIKIAVREIVTNSKIQMALSHSCTAVHVDSNFTALLNIGDGGYSQKDEWAHFMDLLPIFITCRLLFFLVIDSSDIDGSDAMGIEEKVRNLIACINGTLSHRAKDLFSKLKFGKTTIPPYPKIVVVATYNDQILSDTKSAIDRMYEQIKQTFLGNQDSDRFDGYIVCVKSQSDTPIEKTIKDFVQRLRIDTPLQWELFRQIFFLCNA